MSSSKENIVRGRVAKDAMMITSQVVADDLCSAHSARGHGVLKGKEGSSHMCSYHSYKQRPSSAATSMCSQSQASCAATRVLRFRRGSRAGLRQLGPSKPAAILAASWALPRGPGRQELGRLPRRASERGGSVRSQAMQNPQLGRAVAGWGQLPSQRCRSHKLFCMEQLTFYEISVLKC